MKISKYITKYDYIAYYTKQPSMWFYTNTEIDTLYKTEYQLHSHNSTSTGASVGVQLALSNMSLVNPTVSFNYKFTTSRSMNGAFLFYSNLSIALEDYPLYVTSSKTGTFNQQLSGTISYLYFGIDSYNTYTSEVSITNLKINGETINFESLTKIE